MEARGAVSLGTTDAVRVSDLHKRFGGTHALSGVSLTVEQGSIHSLVGENGAGKSTLLGALAGRIGPTRGRVESHGAPGRVGDPRAARRIGIAAIYQELTVVPALSAMANVFLGHPPARMGWRNTRAMRARFLELAEEFGMSVDPRVPACLSTADQQLIEIMRGLQADARIILFDEPTASLAAPERARLHDLMRRLKAHGVTMIFVSHNLDEVLDVSDTITVFRDGAVTRTAQATLWTKPELVRCMLGDADDRLSRALIGDSTDATAGTPVAPAGDRRTALRLEEITLPGVLHGVDLEVREGEIVGVAGLVGSGRTSLLGTLAGLNPSAGGRVSVAGRTAGVPRTVRQAREKGHRDGARGPQGPGARSHPVGRPQHHDVRSRRRGARWVDRPAHHEREGGRGGDPVRLRPSPDVRTGRQPVRRQPAEGSAVPMGLRPARGAPSPTNRPVASTSAPRRTS